MATTTLPQPATQSKPPKAFYCHLYDEAGVLSKLEQTLYFFNPDTGHLLEFEPEMAPFCCVLGEVGISDTQRIMDEMHDGLAAIACSRPN